jgi:hypothetical protein
LDGTEDGINDGSLGSDGIEEGKVDGSLDSDGPADGTDDGSLDIKHGIDDGSLTFDGTEDGIDDGSLDLVGIDESNFDSSLDLDGTDDCSLDFDGTADGNVEGLLDFHGTEDGIVIAAFDRKTRPSSDPSSILKLETRAASWTIAQRNRPSPEPSEQLIDSPIKSNVSSFFRLGATDLLFDWKIDAGDSVSGQERGVGSIELSLITVPDILPVS